MGEWGSLPPASVLGVLGLRWSFICPSLLWTSGNTCSFVGVTWVSEGPHPWFTAGEVEARVTQVLPSPRAPDGLASDVCLPALLWVAVLPQGFNSGPVCCSNYSLFPFLRQIFLSVLLPQTIFLPLLLGGTHPGLQPSLFTLLW